MLRIVPTIQRRAVPPAWALPPSVHPVLQRVFAARGVTTAAGLDTSLAGLHPLEALAGLDHAAGLLGAAVEHAARILIVADFDADGATSCAVAVHALRALGAAHVDYIVPNRFEFGYGLTPEIVELARTRTPDVLVTVDNGISSIAGVAAARAAGIRVVITDHHLPGATLPAADAIVNPNLPGDAFPSKNLAGVGVIFYVMLALRAHLRAAGWFTRQRLAEPNLARLLDLVALGTVADVVPLDHNNRRLVAQGLARIRAGECQPGIRALAEVSGRNLARLRSTDLAFALGPRLNAAGRLADMSLGIECLLAAEPDVCRGMAARLDELNRERRDIEQDMRDQAFAILDGLGLDTGDGGERAGICLFDPQWHQGVVGVLAARVKERYHRPAIAFAPGADGEIKGSARSIPAVHVRDVLDTIAARHPGMLSRFGGHAMAAGVTLARHDFAVFSRAFDAEVKRRLGPEGTAATILTDGELAADEFSIELARAIATAAPWGQGFPEPLFDGEFVIRERRVVGGLHVRLSLQPAATAAARPLAAIAFQAVDEPWVTAAQRIRAVYRLGVNDYQGTETLQLVIDYAAPAG